MTFTEAARSLFFSLLAGALAEMFAPPVEVTLCCVFFTLVVSILWYTRPTRRRFSVRIGEPPASIEIDTADLIRVLGNQKVAKRK